MLAFLLPLSLSAILVAQAPAPAPEQAPPVSNGILQSIANATEAPAGDDLVLTRKDPQSPLVLTFSRCQALGVQREANQWWVLPIAASGARIEPNSALWVLPLDAKSGDHSWYIPLHGVTAGAVESDTALTVTLNADTVTLTPSEARPHSDPFNHRFGLHMIQGAALEDALAGFYWGTMLPSVVEKTMAAPFPYHDGYVLSTLNVKSYAGSYPAVDHEFQIKGRLAIGSPADLDIVRRMIELQFQLMADDPQRLYRAPTSVQPDGRREYHVRRNSKNNRVNAAMFPLTGNIEVLEEAWNYYAATKNIAWLRANIANLEHAADWILSSTDQYGRVWSDVYYEDQVMKDGRETIAQAFTARNLQLLARMETLLERDNMTARYAAASRKISAILIAPLPMGYWDEQNQRFIDWVDRDGKSHDHIHLLANELPVAFGYATPAQSTAVRHLVELYDNQFQRFPSFLAADIAAYNNSEIGDGGPYDLSAAGRYWYWDAAFRTARNQNDILFQQLQSVAAEAAKDNYLMGERYDMDYVYYIDGKNAHGAQKYYEYPNVFASVLISQFLGLTIPADADLSVAPHFTSEAAVDFAIPEYAVNYTWDKTKFTLQNLSTRSRRIQVDLSALAPPSAHYKLTTAFATRIVTTRTTITLPPQAQATWTLTAP